MSDVPDGLAALQTAASAIDATAPGTATNMAFVAALGAVRTTISSEITAAQGIIAGIVTAADGENVFPAAREIVVDMVQSSMVAAGNLANLLIISAYMGRIAVNLTNASP